MAKFNKPHSSTAFMAIYNAVATDHLTARGLSGGDRIMMELMRKWESMFRSFTVVTCPSGAGLLDIYLPHRKSLTIHTLDTPRSYYRSLLRLYWHKTMKGIEYFRRLPLEDGTYLFTSSDFLPDVLPAIMAKRRNPKVKWIAAFYFFAASPFSKEFPYKGIGGTFRGVMYYLTQSVAYYLIRRRADYVLLCNEVDAQIFAKAGYPRERMSAIYGGVDLAEARSVPEPPGKPYDAVFMARFHPQKGPMEAIRAWELVVKDRPKAHLVMIGIGPEREKMDAYIKAHDLENNIKIVGFLDGKEKYKVLKSARLFVHSAIYETGGMAAAEGMAAGLPVVAFDHKGFDYCYPRGMDRVAPIGDVKKLAAKILELLDDKKKYSELRADAVDFVQEWDWEYRAEFLLKEFGKI